MAALTQKDLTWDPAPEAASPSRRAAPAKATVSSAREKLRSITTTCNIAWLASFKAYDAARSGFVEEAAFVQVLDDAQSMGTRATGLTADEYTLVLRRYGNSKGLVSYGRFVSQFGLGPAADHLDPELYITRLPQPYRMITNLLEEHILGAAWEMISKRHAPKRPAAAATAAAAAAASAGLGGQAGGMGGGGAGGGGSGAAPSNATAPPSAVLMEVAGRMSGAAVSGAASGTASGGPGGSAVDTVVPGEGRCAIVAGGGVVTIMDTERRCVVLSVEPFVDGYVIKYFSLYSVRILYIQCKSFAKLTFYLYSGSVTWLCLF